MLHCIGTWTTFYMSSKDLKFCGCHILYVNIRIYVFYFTSHALFVVILGDTPCRFGRQASVVD